MKGVLSFLTFALIIFAGIFILENRIHNSAINERPFSDDNHFLYLTRKIGSDFKIKSYSLDGVDAPNRMQTNTKGTSKYVGKIEKIDVPLIGTFHSSEQVAGLAFNESEVCLVLSNSNKLCVDKPFDQIIPLVEDSDHDGKDDLFLYSYSSGEWAIFSVGSSLELKYKFNSKRGGYPLVVKGINSMKAGVWIESTQARFEFSSFKEPNVPVDVFAFGLAGDIPFSFDKNCDGNQSVGVYRRSTGTWYFRNPRSEPSSVTWGTSTSFPFVKDVNGDGCEDTALFDRKADFTFAIFPSIFSDESLEIFPDGNAVISKINWGKPEETPPELWPYKLYKEYRSNRN